MKIEFDSVLEKAEAYFCHIYVEAICVECDLCAHELYITILKGLYMTEPWCKTPSTESDICLHLQFQLHFFQWVRGQ